MSHRLGLHKFDDRVKKSNLAQPLTQNRKKGRPASTQEARARQANEIQEEQRISQLSAL
jgi:hypothetical protein